ncbi:MAG: hypothetical protein KJ726_11455 [Verrucomicrobia bacterium]|nr:hypothetical protein [Verrucomicrobiota bacterium]MBU1910654.1 hypothetical protein [Verrucomicrobiota bacterium]
MRRRGKQNRKTIQDGPVFPVPLALILVLVTGVAFGFLWLRDKCDTMGRRLQDLEARRDEVQRQVLREEYKWSNLKSPQNIERLMAQFNLKMVWPGERDTVRLRRPELEPEGPAEMQYAQRLAATRHD